MLANAEAGTPRRHQGALPQADRSAASPRRWQSLEASLKRLGMEQVDIFHLHNAITTAGGGEIALGVRWCSEEVVAGVREAARAGQDAVPRHHRGGRHGGAASGDRFRRLRQRAGQLQHAEPQSAGDGASARLSGAGLRPAVRSHAGGRRRRGRHPRAGRRRAVSGVAERHPIASPPPEPIGSALRYDATWQRARRLMPLVTEGLAGSLAEAAVRFAISHPGDGHDPGRHGDAGANSSRRWRRCRKARCRRPRWTAWQLAARLRRRSALMA